MHSEISFSGTVVTMVLLIHVGVLQVERIHYNNPSVQVLVEKKPSRHHEVQPDYIACTIERVFYHCTCQAATPLLYWAKILNASSKQIKECSYVWLSHCS